MWRNGTYLLTFTPSPANPNAQYFQNGVPFSKFQTVPVLGPGSLDNTGSFTSVAVPDNQTIFPSGSSWNLQVCPAATATNGCFIRNLVITGASMNVTSSVIPPPIVVNLTNPLPGAAAYNDAEIVGARQGSLYFNLTDNSIHVCSGFPVCIWIAEAAGVGSVTPSGNGIYLATTCPTLMTTCFTVFDDVQADLNATYSIGSATVTTSAPTAPFLCPGGIFPCSAAGPGSDVGKIIWGTANCGAGTPAVSCTYNLPQGTISTVNSPHSVTASTTAIANSGGGNNPLFWGHDDGSQIAASNAAMIANALYGPASSLTFPCGVMFTSVPPLIQPSTVTAVTYGIQGCGGGGTTIMPLPRMNCTGGAGFGCLISTSPHSVNTGNVQAGGHFRDLVFYGGGLDVPDAGATFTAGTSGIYVSGFDSLDNVWVLGWLWNNSVSNPGITNNGALMINSGTVGAGRDNCFLNGLALRPAAMHGGSCGGSHATSITATAGQVSTFGVYGRPASGFFTSISMLNSGAIWYSHGDTINGDFQSTGGSTYFSGTEINQNGAGGSPINANGGTIHLQNVRLSSAGASIAQTSGTVYDDCGNGPFNTAASTITNLYGDCSITGVADVAGNHALTSGWGTANVNTVTGSTKDIRFTISITGGVPAGGPVLTDTFAVPFLATPNGGCTLIQVGGTFAVITNPVSSSLTRTGVTWTFAGTPVNGQSYSFVRHCAN